MCDQSDSPCEGFHWQCCQPIFKEKLFSMSSEILTKFYAGLQKRCRCMTAMCWPWCTPTTWMPSSLPARTPASVFTGTTSGRPFAWDTPQHCQSSPASVFTGTISGRTSAWDTPKSCRLSILAVAPASRQGAMTCVVPMTVHNCSKPYACACGVKLDMASETLLKLGTCHEVTRCVRTKMYGQVYQHLGTAAFAGLLL